MHPSRDCLLSIWSIVLPRAWHAQRRGVAVGIGGYCVKTFDLFSGVLDTAEREYSWACVLLTLA